MSVQSEIDRLLALQAAEWYERLKEGAGQSNREFLRWVTESPRHLKAFLAVAGEAPMIRRAFADGSFDLSEVLQKITPEVVPLRVHAQSIASKPPAATPRRPTRPTLRLFAAAATLATLTIGAILYNWATSPQHFETPIGEQRTIQLTEGSVVNLNALSRIEVRFSDKERDVRLRGEATFKVAHDRTRPFRVHTPGTIVEAVGTQFNVYARPDGTTTVSVLEGRVKITTDESRGTRDSAPPLPLAAGEEARIERNGQIEREKHSDVAESIAWQQRRLIFKRTPLDDIAAEFNRYNRSTRIRLEGIDPGTFRFSGAFDADDPQSFAAVLMHEPELAVAQGSGEIVIRPAER